MWQIHYWGEGGADLFFTTNKAHDLGSTNYCNSLPLAIVFGSEMDKGS